MAKKLPPPDPDADSTGTEYFLTKTDPFAKYGDSWSKLFDRFAIRDGRALADVVRAIQAAK